MTEPEPQYPLPRKAFAIVFFTFLLIMIAEFVIIKAGVGGRKEAFFVETIVIIPALFYVWKHKLSPVEIFRLRWPGIKIALVSMLIGIGMLVLSDSFERLAAIILPQSDALDKLQENMRQSLITQNVSELCIIIFVIVFMAGILEEMLFRGFLLVSLEQSGDITKAVMLTAFVFSFFHYVWIIWPWAFIQILMLGVVLGVLAWKSDSIVPAVIIHMVNNAAKLIFLYTEEETLTWYEWKGQVAPWIVLPAIGLVWFGIKYFYRTIDAEQEEYEPEVEE